MPLSYPKSYGNGVSLDIKPVPRGTQFARCGRRLSVVQIHPCKPLSQASMHVSFPKAGRLKTY